MASNIFHVNLRMIGFLSFISHSLYSKFNGVGKAMNEPTNSSSPQWKKSGIYRYSGDNSVLKKSKSAKIDFLLIDNKEAWGEIIMETLGNIYKYDIASNYEDAVKKILGKNYKAICLSQPFYTTNKWRNILMMIKSERPDAPVIVINSNPIENVENIKTRYPNIKKIISKNDSDFVSKIFTSLPSLLKTH